MHIKRLISGVCITGLIRGIILGIDGMIASSTLLLIFCVLYRGLPLLPDDLQAFWIEYGRTSTLVIALVMSIQALLMNAWDMVLFWILVRLLTRYFSIQHSLRKSSRVVMRGKKTFSKEEMVTLGSIIVAIGGLLSANAASIPGANLVMMSLVGWLVTIGRYALQPHHALGQIVRRLPFLLRSGILVFSLVASFMTRYATLSQATKTAPAQIQYIVLPGANSALTPPISGLMINH